MAMGVCHYVKTEQPHGAEASDSTTKNPRSEGLSLHKARICKHWHSRYNFEPESTGLRPWYCRVFAEEQRRSFGIDCGHCRRRERRGWLNWKDPDL